jgi:hypothetical protein
MLIGWPQDMDNVNLKNNAVHCKLLVGRGFTEESAGHEKSSVIICGTTLSSERQDTSSPVSEAHCYVDCWHNRPIGGRSADWIQLDSTPHYTNTTLTVVCLK